MNRNLLIIIILILAVLVFWLLFAPPQFWLNMIKRVDTSDPVGTGQALVEQYNCKSCHQIGKVGRIFGPSLNGVTRRISEEELRLWLLNPRKVNPATAMPDLNLSEQEAEALISYLQTLEN